MATRKRRSTRGLTWLRVLTKDDLDALRSLLVRADEKRAEWEYKLHRGSIIIYTPVIPWNPRTRKPDASMRYMDKSLRVVPTPAGPFQLEYMRHTGRWWPYFDATGNIKAIAKAIDDRALVPSDTHD